MSALVFSCTSRVVAYSRRAPPSQRRNRSPDPPIGQWQLFFPLSHFWRRVCVSQGKQSDSILLLLSHCFSDDKASVTRLPLSAPSVPGMGAAYGTAKSGVGIASMGVMRPELVMKSIVPVVMAGVLGIYGLIIAVIISTNSASPRGSAPCHMWATQTRTMPKEGTPARRLP